MAERNVVHYISKFSPTHWGGAEESIVHLGNELERRGFRSSVWSSKIFSAESRDEVDGIEVRRFPSFFLSKTERASAGLGKAPLSPALLSKLLVEENVDLLHVHAHNRMGSALVALARAKGLPVVVTLHSRFNVMEPRWRYWYPNEFGIRHATHVIAVTSSIRDSVIRAGLKRPGEVTVLGNGVTPEVFGMGDGGRFRSSLGLEDEPLILTIGRINKAKNQKVALDILPHVHQAIPRAHWAIVGFPSDLDYYRALKKAIAARRFEAVIHMIGGLPPRSAELADAYAAADIVVIPSLQEAFGIVLLEAWASHTPVVATALGGPKDLIREGLTGLLVDIEDHRATADRIIELLRDPARAQKIVREAGRSVRDFSWPALAERLASLYEKVLSTRT